MSVCEIFPHTLDYFSLDEKDAGEVIDFIRLMVEKGKLSNNMLKQTNKKKVYADQVNWH